MARAEGSSPGSLAFGQVVHSCELGVPWPCAAAVRLLWCIRVSLCCLHACVLIGPGKMEQESGGRWSERGLLHAWQACPIYLQARLASELYVHRQGIWRVREGERDKNC